MSAAPKLKVTVKRRRRVSEPLLLDDPFRSTVDAYVRNLISGTSLLVTQKAQRWRFIECDVLYDLAKAQVSPKRSRAVGSSAETQLTEDEIRSELLKLMRKWRGAPVVPPPSAAAVEINLGVLASTLGLDEVDRRVLQFVIIAEHHQSFRELVAHFRSLTLDAAAKAVAIACVLPESAVLAALQPRSRLAGSGLVEVSDHLADLEDKLTTHAKVLDLVLRSSLDRKTIMDCFLPTARLPSLALGDFDHISDAVTTARTALRAAVRLRRPGVNILLYGPTGTGKTELARLLAAELSVPLYVTGHDDEEGEADEAYERLTSLRLANQLVGATDAILMFDELEDLFTWGFVERAKHGTARMSKSWFNDLLETNAAPTIWISNSTHGIDPAFLRRFAYAIEVPALGARQRARVLRRHLRDVSQISDADVDVIAQRFDASPAQLGSAVATAKMLTGEAPVDRRTIEGVLAPVVKLVTGVDSSRVPAFDASLYDIDVLNSPDDLKGIADQLSTWRPGEGLGVSLCLHGAPGTGKSEYVKYLAHRMGRRILYRRVSDLQSPYIGVCEKNIAQAFREAEQDDAVLLFDEADSFLRDRRGAHRSWEISQVNEFLQQLEAYRGVVACTTNLFEELDQASLRRFVFKIEFRYMRAEQAVRLFRKVFAGLVDGEIDDDAVASELKRMPPLAPGDFAAARRQLVVRAETRKAVPTICGALSSEAGSRSTVRRVVGF